MVPTFLPLLEDSDPSHLHLVCFAVKTLQKLMDYSSSAVSLFKELGGVELLAQRLQIEVHRVIGLAGDNDNSMVTGECSRYSDDQLYSQKRLIKASLKALGSATYAAGNATRAQHSHDSSLPATLSQIFANVEKFGGDIYYSAVTVLSETIHKDPTCFSALHEMGLPDAFISSVVAGVHPSAKALTCVPNGLGAICLNAKGLEAVKERSALRFLVDIFTSKKYVVAMNEAIVPLANAVEELLRHVSSLRSTGVDIIVEIIDKIASFTDSHSTGAAGKANGSTAMEMDSEDKENEGHCCLVGAADSAADGISDEQFIQLSIFHLMVLVHRTMENSETCRLFVEKSGIDALLKLLLQPTIVQSSDGMSIALHSTMVFKGFTQHHSAALARAFCSSLRDHLKKALSGFGAVSGSFLLEPRMASDGGIFSSLFLVEFLLFIAASKDNRWVTALLTEFGNGSKDVVEDIGRVHREVLWQIALLEDTKSEVVDDSAGSTTTESPQSETNTSETEEHRFNSFRQFLDPLLRRRTSGWSIESQFLDLISLYRDLGRASSQQRTHSDGPSNLRIGSSQQFHPSGSSDAVGPLNRKEHDQQRSYYTSCCDMVRSLSFHITHLFQELGKVMSLPSRRRDDVVNVSPSAKSVASTFASIAFDHLNFEGHANSSGSEASISTKCRYFGKVIDFIDVSLLERPDSCNAVLLNCLYGHGVVQSVLKTFEATSQLLFTVRAPASPMETDDGNAKQDEREDTDHSWIYGPLASYGKLMDHLVTSSFILSPFTKHLLAQPLANGNIPFPRDAETFVKVLQSMVLKAILPLWTHPQFVDCSYDFISAVISIIRHIYSGVEVKNVSSSSSARITGPPPNETTISTIVEMGFSRSRAEEALRQVGSNSVELAMEWLFSHPEEIQEDDELARALAMSLGNPESDTKEAGANDNAPQLEEEMVQLPPVEELLSTCTKLLQMKEPLAFPVRDLLVMICSQNDGQYRPNIISFIVDRIKESSLIFDNGNSTLLSALFHVLALILQEDAVAREIASKNGLVKVASDLLSQWDSGSVGREKREVPRWVTTAFLAIDRLLQVDQKLNSEISEQLKKDGVGSQQTSLSIDEDKQNKLQSALGVSSKHIEVKDQKRLIEIACSCIRNQLPSETMHAVLQLCSTLTKTHAVAVHFLDAGGLSLLLSLPTSSLFPGFDNIAATIIRHVLEDPQTLQQAMEFEIRHNLVAAANRHSNGRVSPRNFLSSLSSAISRDPVIFMRAAQSICQVDMVVASGNGHGKVHDSNSKSAKVHRKYPQSFVCVIELLLDSVCTYVPPSKDNVVVDVLHDTPSSTDMEIDVAAIKGKGKAIASVSEDNEAGTQEAPASLAKVVFVLKLLTEILLMYASSAHVLLRKDAEIGSCRAPSQKGPTAVCTGGIFHHVLHKFLPYSRSAKKEKKADGDWRHKLASRASQFLVASCVRSSEARKRVFTEISYIFNDFVDSCNGFRPPDNEIQAFCDLLNDVLAARTPTGSYISAEASATFIDAGLVGSLTRCLQVLDLDHADSPKVVTGLLKALELVTKEHVHSADSNAGKGDNSTKPPDHNQSGMADNIGERSQSMETPSQSHHDSAPAEHIESFNAVQSFGGSEAVTDDMEHDQDLDGGFAPANEEDYMNENSEETRGLENGIDTMGIRDHGFPNETLHVMPVEVFGSRRQGRTTSIYSLLGRTGENAAPSRHPLLVGPLSLSSAPPRQSDNARDVVLPDINSERNGRHGHRLNLWMDDNQQGGGSNASAVPHGLEDLLVSQLRRPTPDKPSEENNTKSVDSQNKGETVELQESETGVRPEMPVENNVILKVEIRLLLIQLITLAMLI
ncbi:E3 ubiquitin-protein ligase UPL2-like [Prunus yedoensis var. nudiflora]|uniref:E3 ubiquitin-protein ligase UPL2-like n=1 Tax=Prunus yedoensis var. nudiflora TaxID=2094558 RepID=A0A314YN80_PRUYE|nr:E3 ubiquitin-protein ligase UPL2-like [Prunus yedoensis var. nudiflora]